MKQELSDERRRLRASSDRSLVFHEIPERTNDVAVGSFKNGLRIDKHDLDEELIKQPSSFSDVVDALALAKSRRDLLKDEVDTMEAHLSLSVRAEKDAAGDKCTEGTVKALVQVHPKRLKAFRDLVQAEREVIELDGLREAYRNRGFMLTELVQLHNSAYFQENSAKGSDMMKKEADAARAREAMAQRRSERNRQR